MDPRGMVEVFKALSSDRRLEIVRLLSKNCRLCAGAISRRLDLSPSSASQHLRVLKQAGLVEDCRCGNNIHYSLNRACMAELSVIVSDMLESADRNNDECADKMECEKRIRRGGLDVLLR